MRRCRFGGSKPPPLAGLVFIENADICAVEVEGGKADKGFHSAVWSETVKSGQVGFDCAKVFTAHGFDDLGQDLRLHLPQHIAAPQIVVVTEAGVEGYILHHSWCLAVDAGELDKLHACDLEGISVLDAGKRGFLGAVVFMVLSPFTWIQR